MTSAEEARIAVRLTPTNPGQFFACCGLLELGDRLWHGAEGWFDDRDLEFFVRPVTEGGDASLTSLIAKIGAESVEQLDQKDHLSSPLQLGPPFSLRLDWWLDSWSGGRALKVWAGSMSCVRIARGMQSALGKAAEAGKALLDWATVVREPGDEKKKVEPFYFDARRGASARSLDVGFAPDSLSMLSLACPATEFLALVGLQRFRPAPHRATREFTYWPWHHPLSPLVASLAVAGHDTGSRGLGYQFEVVYRTDQRKHKAFAVASTPRSEQ